MLLLTILPFQPLNLRAGNTMHCNLAQTWRTLRQCLHAPLLNGTNNRRLRPSHNLCKFFDRDGLFISSYHVAPLSLLAFCQSDILSVLSKNSIPHLHFQWQDVTMSLVRNDIVQMLDRETGKRAIGMNQGTERDNDSLATQNAVKTETCVTKSHKSRYTTEEPAPIIDPNTNAPAVCKQCRRVFTSHYQMTAAYFADDTRGLICRHRASCAKRRAETVCDNCDGAGHYLLHSDTYGTDDDVLCWCCNGTGNASGKARESEAAK